MNLLLDTNILLSLIKDPSLELLTNIINPDEKRILISVISILELKSIALQNSWGDRKLGSIDTILNKIPIIEVNQNLVNTYAEIDAYSQRRNPKYNDYLFSTPRNMGKMIYG